MYEPQKSNRQGAENAKDMLKFTALMEFDYQSEDVHYRCGL